MLRRLVIKIFICMSFNDAPAQVFSCKVLLINVYSRDGNKKKLVWECFISMLKVFFLKLVPLIFVGISKSLTIFLNVNQQKNLFIRFV